MNNTRPIFKKSIRLVLLILSVVFLCSAYMDFDSDFLVEEKDPIKTEKFLDSTAITPLRKFPSAHHISCFDVNEDGNIAIVFKGMSTVAVLDNDGEFLYGFEIKTNGSLYVEWGTDCLNVIFVRGGTIVSLDEKGNILNIGVVGTGNDLISVSTDTTRTVGNEVYRLSNRDMEFIGFWSGGYSKIERYDKLNDETTIIYDVSDSTISKMTFIVLGVLVFMNLVSLIAFLDIRRIVRNKRRINNQLKL